MERLKNIPPQRAFEPTLNGTARPEAKIVIPLEAPTEEDPGYETTVGPTNLTYGYRLDNTSNNEGER